uniref:C-type lectin domain-containing protein n=1 Tax=Stegastes partitus TaxID=144197 RepID=A0A3B5AF72_9TELE
MTGGQNPNFVSDCLLSASDSHCDKGWLLYGDHCYHFETEVVKNWQDAETHCASEQGHLVSFHSQQELSFLTGEQLIKAHQSDPADDVWTGLNDLFIPGMFTWSDEHITTFTYWAPGEPNNHDGFHEDCVEITNGTVSWWNDLNCDAHLDWICKIAKGKDPIQPPEPPPPIPGNT